MHTCTSLSSRFSSNAHHHGLLPQQRGVVWDLLLKADPEGPSLIYRAASHTVVSSTHCKPPSVLLQHTVPQKVETLVRYSAGSSLLLVNRQAQPLHDLAHRRQRFISTALATDHQIVGIVDDVRTKPSVEPPFLPPQYETAHVQIGQKG